MVWKDCGGRKCQLGWGYNEHLDTLIDISGKPPNITSTTKKDWQYFVYHLSSTSIPHLDSINLFAEPKCRSLLNFEIVCDENEYWQVECHFIKKREGARRNPACTVSCSHFTRWVDYGVDFWIQFPKAEFPQDEDEVRALFKEGKFSEAQKKVKCRVLLNYEKIEEKTLKEVIRFMMELDQGKYSEYDIPIRFYCVRLDQEVHKVSIDNQNEFSKFLSYLYCVCQKIEMKMCEAKYPIASVENYSNEQSSVKICSNLNKVKEEYISMDKTDFSKMYPVLKRLLTCYAKYIEYLMKQEDDIDDGEYLPGTAEDLQQWLKMLNDWTPKN